MALFVASFLVLFLETVLIRWMPAYVRLLAYVINLLGRLAGVAAFALVSWLDLPPVFWFGLAAAAALPLMTRQTTATAIVGAVLLVASVSMVYGIQEGSLWSPYYRITVF